jgi:hypothetical protein
LDFRLSDCLAKSEITALPIDQLGLG